MAYTVFESANMAATYYAEKIFDAVASTDIENGTFGYLNGLSENGGVIYNFVKGTTSGLTAGDIVVADNPAWSEDTSRIINQRKDKYIIPAGTPFRARVIKKTDLFGISIDGFTAATQSVVTAVTNFKTTTVYVTIDSTTGKLVASTTAPESAIVVGKIERSRITGATLVTTANTYGSSKVIYEVRVTSVATE